MLKKLNRRDRIALTAAAVATALFLLLNFGLLPLLEHLGRSPEVIQQEEVELRREQRLLAETQLAKTRLTAAEAHVTGLEAGLLDSSVPALANAEWQRLVGELADSKGIQISSSEFLRTQEIGGGYSLSTGRVVLHCRIDQLVDFWVALTSSPKFLPVTDLMVSTSRGNAQAPLNVQMTIGAVTKTVKQPKSAATAAR